MVDSHPERRDPWDVFEEVLKPLCDQLESSSPEEAERRLSEVLEVFESHLDRKDMFVGAQVYTAAANLLAANVCKAKIWRWLRKCAKLYRDDRFQEALGIAVLEPVAEEPTRADDIEELMEFLRDPKTAWGVYCAYDQQGRTRLFDDYAWYAERCRLRGEVSPELSPELVEEWFADEG